VGFAKQIPVKKFKLIKSKEYNNPWFLAWIELISEFQTVSEFKIVLEKIASGVELKPHQSLRLRVA